MPATQAGNNNTNRVNSALVAFPPLQVPLGSQAMKHISDNNDTSNGTLPLKSEQKVLLHHSIAQYLQPSGFSKTLKKFCSEARIEKDNVEESSVDLQAMCLKYLQTKASINIQKEKQGQHEDKFVVDTENASKKKKKKSDKSDCGVIVDQSGTAGTFKDSKNSGNETSYPGTESKVTFKDKNTDDKCKEKKKKKSKLASVSFADNVEGNQLEASPILPEVKLKYDLSEDAKTVAGAETEKRSKDKKKKRDKSCVACPVVDMQEVLENKEIVKKDAKKRRRQTSEENDIQIAEGKVDEEPKRRKIENMDESNAGKQSSKTDAEVEANINTNKENIGKSGQLDGNQLQKTSGEQPNGKTNGNIEKAGEKSSMQRSQNKQQKGSIEPKTVMAFQRVKIDEIVYADERLQDNSYWAKDGADYGYGAKAEEVLGQVRGRDFRHEKTKKKRGTYRGGQIDLQSHSVKFNYSDDD